MTIAIKKHSILGIIACVIGIICIFCLCLIMTLSITTTSERSSFVVNSFSVLLGLVSLVGVTLGIIGTVQKEQKKIFAIIGLILNLLTLLIISWGWISVILGI